MDSSIYLRWAGCGHFDVLMGDVNVCFDPYLFGEDLEQAEPIFDYIFISHEHFDHCHPRTLRKLCRGDRFKKLFVPIGCITPDEPIDEKYGDAAFERDLPITRHIPEDKVRVVYPKYQDVGRYGERTGDLHGTYPLLENLRGRVDYLIHMKTEMDPLIDAVQPKFVIPTHYRADRESEPIPTGHWPPNLTDVNAFLEDLRDQIDGRAKLLPLTAPIRYEVEMPAKKVRWAWEWYNSWDIPAWREE